MTEIAYGGRGKFMPTTGHQRWMVFWKRNQSHTWLHTLQVHSDLMGGKGRDQGSCTALIARYIVMYHSALRNTTGPVGSTIYADLHGSIKIKFSVLNRNTDQ